MLTRLTPLQFAQTCDFVISIDIDPIKIAIARLNAAVYGVADRIAFIQGDFLELAPRLKADVVFLSPPWGGLQHNYVDDDAFDLSTMIEPNGNDVFAAASSITHNIAYMVPRNTPTQQLRDLSEARCEVEDNWFQGAQSDSARMKMRTAYYGDLAFNYDGDLVSRDGLLVAGDWEPAKNADAFSFSTAASGTVCGAKGS